MVFLLIYQKAKLIGDTEINIPTQFVLSKNARGRNMGEPPSPQTIHNIILKINSKLGGTNQDLAGPSRQELTLGQNQTIFSKPIMVWFIRYIHQFLILNLRIFLTNIFYDFFFKKKHLVLN